MVERLLSTLQRSINSGQHHVQSILASPSNLEVITGLLTHGTPQHQISCAKILETFLRQLPSHLYGIINKDNCILHLVYDQAKEI